MPRLDKTGPEGKGPITGRGLGRCKGNAGKAPKPISRRQVMFALIEDSLNSGLTRAQVNPYLPLHSGLSLFVNDHPVYF